MNNETQKNEQALKQEIISSKCIDSFKKSTSLHHARRLPLVTEKARTNHFLAKKRGDKYFHIGCGKIREVADYQ